MLPSNYHSLVLKVNGIQNWSANFKGKCLVAVQTAEAEPREESFQQLRGAYHGNFSRRIYSWQPTRRTEQ